MLEVVIGLASAALLTNEPFGRREVVGAVFIVAACGSEFFALTTHHPKSTAMMRSICRARFVE